MSTPKESYFMTYDEEEKFVQYHLKSAKENLERIDNKMRSLQLAKKEAKKILKETKQAVKDFYKHTTKEN